MPCLFHPWSAMMLMWGDGTQKISSLAIRNIWVILYFQQIANGYILNLEEAVLVIRFHKIKCNILEVLVFVLSHSKPSVFEKGM